MVTNQADALVAKFTDSSTDGFERLEDGVYEAAVCGYVARNFQDYNDPNKTVQKFMVVLQVALDGQCYYLKTRPFTFSLNEKSNFFIWLSSATGATLPKIREKYPEGFPLSNLIGVACQAVVNTVTGKKDATKEYANLANTLKAKKGQKTAVVQDAIPAYLVRDAVAYNFAAGLTIKEEEAPQAATLPAGLPGGIAAGAAAPQMPANAHVTQNQNAAAFMGATQQPAEEDDDEKLPF